MGIPGKMYTIDGSPREWSYTFFDQDVVDYFHKYHPSKETSILDIGAGGGKYARLLSDYPNIDAVEAWQPYVDQLNLKGLYKNVFVQDILDFDFDFYDVIIMGDVLEHIDANKAVGLMKRLMQKTHDMVVILPYQNVLDEALEGNHYEKHLQPDLTDEIIQKRYPMLKKIASNETSGMWIFNPSLRKNYLFHTFYDSGVAERNALYRRMQEISYKTFTENIQEVFDYRVWEEAYTPDIASAFFFTMKIFFEYWKENANILYVDMDTLCVKPISVFSDIHHFTSFWTSDPPSKPDAKYYMNTGVKYFPASVPRSVMEYGIKNAKDFLEHKPDVTPWASDQYMYINMMEKQGIPFENLLDNSMNWIYLPSLNTTGLNVIEQKDAKIIHFHSTRDLEETVKIMEEYDRGSRTFN